MKYLIFSCLVCWIHLASAQTTDLADRPAVLSESYVFNTRLIYQQTFPDGTREAFSLQIPSPPAHYGLLSYPNAEEQTLLPDLVANQGLVLKKLTSKEASYFAAPLDNFFIFYPNGYLHWLHRLPEARPAEAARTLGAYVCQVYTLESPTHQIAYYLTSKLGKVALETAPLLTFSPKMKGHLVKMLVRDKTSKSIYSLELQQVEPSGYRLQMSQFLASETAQKQTKSLAAQPPPATVQLPPNISILKTRPYSSHVTAVQYSNGKYGFVDATNRPVSLPLFDDVQAYDPSTQRGLARKGIWWGYLDAHGHEAIPFEFEEAHAFSEASRLVAARRGGHWGLINSAGKAIVPFELQAAGFASELTAVKMQGKWGFVNELGKLVIEPQYEDAMYFEEGLCPVKKDGKWGFIDAKGILKIKFLYEEAYTFSDGEAQVRFKNVYQTINKQGKCIDNCR